MITQEEIKKVETLQKLEEEKIHLKNDYSNLRFNRLGLEGTYLTLYYNYEKFVKIAIKNKIRIVNKKIKKSLEEN